ncbi:MAG: DUF59 domain-containing protein [Alphaproteobacteria bacterium]|nr:DUF59 domain-containing protein [Alphaproteobacteria bacterium]
MVQEKENAEYKAMAGEPLKKGQEKASLETIIEAIRQVYDPEIPINVYDMGLIYHIDIQENGDIFIDMSLTAPGCPVAGVLPAQVAQAVADVEGAGVTTVKVVWEPQWTIERMTEEGRAMIDLF